ncbi:hypothetical protein TNCV_2109621 [Trichonephila clavipes]|nr:hypothetical protein TNCV_2109621 [Trichonephila clavipes]
MSEDHEIHHSKGLDERLLLTIALSIIQMTLRFSSFPPEFCGRTPWRWSETSHISSLYINLTRELTARWLFRAMPLRHYTFTNIHASSEIRNQALRGSNPRD